MKKLMLLLVSVMILANCGSEQNFDNLFQPSGWDEMATPDNSNFYKLFGAGASLYASGYGDGNLYKANAGGKTWTQHASLSPEYVEQLQYINATIGYACGDYGYVYKTTDGGANWQEIGPAVNTRIVERFREVPGANKYPAGLFISYREMCFSDENTGYISGMCYKPSVGYNKTFEELSYVTKDGGETWTYTVADDVAEMKSSILKSANKKNISVDDKYMHYYLTNNQVWMSYYDAEFGFQVGSSTDGGATWKYFARPTSTKGDWTETSKVFVNATTGFLFGGTAEGSGVGFYTQDGGETWKEIASDWTYITDAILSNGSIYLSGKEGKIYRSKKV